MSAKIAILFLRFIVIVIAMTFLGGLLQTISYDIVLPFSLVLLGISGFLFLKPGRLGRSMAVPFFISFLLVFLLWFSMFAFENAISIPDQFDVIFALVIVIGLLGYILMALRDGRSEVGGGDSE